MHGTDDWNATERRSAERRGSDRPWTQSTIRVGSEMVNVAEVATSLESFGDQYLRLVYTDDEAATCTTVNGPSPERLAARFAAKESVIKALRPVEPISLRDIEITTDADGGPEVVLRGSVADHAETIGVVDTSLSLTHHDGRASAVFVAVMATPLPSIDLPEPTIDPLAKLSDLYPAGIPFDPRPEPVPMTTAPQEHV